VVSILNKEKEKDAKANPAQVVNLEEKRPMGQKKAKNERNGKGKGTDALAAFGEKLENFIEVSNKARREREKITEFSKAWLIRRLKQLINKLSVKC
jgi:hypothetical protein